eukprot:TRINITY_DN32612_c0_g1_i1.p2 TRINITY_DN32612_c0_g1~~TRINITY_DN32612_c0_g1_i1.p2  ORF type:complete len:105 (+),score=8.99 TRINITY_DN32612_c0_g1_i1:149-463(+)
MPLITLHVYAVPRDPEVGEYEGIYVKVDTITIFVKGSTLDLATICDLLINNRELNARAYALRGGKLCHVEIYPSVNGEMAGDPLETHKAHVLSADSTHLAVVHC